MRWVWLIGLSMVLAMAVMPASANAPPVIFFNKISVSKDIPPWDIAYSPVVLDRSKPIVVMALGDWTPDPYEVPGIMVVNGKTTTVYGRDKIFSGLNIPNGYVLYLVKDGENKALGIATFGWDYRFNIPPHPEIYILQYTFDKNTGSLISVKKLFTVKTTKYLGVYINDAGNCQLISNDKLLISGRAYIKENGNVKVVPYVGLIDLNSQKLVWEWAIEDMNGEAFAVSSGDKIVLIAVNRHSEDVRIYVGDLDGRFELKKTISSVCPFVVWNKNTIGYADLNSNNIYIYDINSNKFEKVYTTEHTVANGWGTSYLITSDEEGNYVITYRATDGNVYLATFNTGFGFSKEQKLYELGNGGIGGLTLLTDKEIIIVFNMHPAKYGLARLIMVDYTRDGSAMLTSELRGFMLSENVKDEWLKRFVFLQGNKFTLGIRLALEGYINSVEKDHIGGMHDVIDLKRTEYTLDGWKVYKMTWIASGYVSKNLKTKNVGLVAVKGDKAVVITVTKNIADKTFTINQPPNHIHQGFWPIGVVPYPHEVTGEIGEAEKFLLDNDVYVYLNDRLIGNVRNIGYWKVIGCDEDVKIEYDGEYFYITRLDYTTPPRQIITSRFETSILGDEISFMHDDLVLKPNDVARYSYIVTLNHVATEMDKQEAKNIASKLYEIALEDLESSSQGGTSEGSSGMSQISQQSVNAEGKAIINVDSEPKGVEVYLNGKFYGRTPAKIEVEPDKYVIELYKEGYEVYTHELVAESNKEYTLYVTMKKEQPKQYDPTFGGKFLEPPTVTLHLVKDRFEPGGQGVIELSIRNPSVNDIALAGELNIKVPSNLAVEGGDVVGGGGYYSSTFIAKPGVSRVETLYITCLDAKPGRYLIHAKVYYYPQGDRENYHELTLTKPIEVIGTDNNKKCEGLVCIFYEYPEYIVIIVAIIVVGAVAIAYARRKPPQIEIKE